MHSRNGTLTSGFNPENSGGIKVRLKHRPPCEPQVLRNKVTISATFFCLATSEPRRGKHQRVISATVLSGNFRAQTRQATASHFGDGFVWQLPSPDSASNSESFRRRFGLATSEPRRGKQQRIISATVLSGNFRAQTRHATANHFGDGFVWQLPCPDAANNSESFRRRFCLATSEPERGKQQRIISAAVLSGNFRAQTRQTTASHFGDGFVWQLPSPDATSNSESFRRWFCLATSEPRRRKQQRIISATVLSGNFRTQTRQATANQFGDSFVWQLPSPDAASNSESFRRRFCLATSVPGRGKKQRVISATVLSGNFRARTRQATANHFGGGFVWQLPGPDAANNGESFRRRFCVATSEPRRGRQQRVISAMVLSGNFRVQTPQATTNHFGDGFVWQLPSPDAASNSESFWRRFCLTTSEPRRGKQQRVISATVLSGNFRAQTRQATTSHFGDAFAWQLSSPDAASNSESFRRRFCLATSKPRRGNQQRFVSATVLSGNFQAQTRQATTNHFGDGFVWQLPSPDAASNSESFRRRFCLATSEPRRGKQ